MRNQDIFIKIIDLIESQTNIPIFQKDLGKWLLASKTNRNIYEIYKMANMARNEEVEK